MQSLPDVAIACVFVSMSVRQPYHVFAQGSLIKAGCLCVHLQGLCAATLQASPCPLASSPGCPALPTLEGAAAAVGLLAAVCLSLHWRWRINIQLDLSQRLLLQMQSQGDKTLLFVFKLLFDFFSSWFEVV